MSQEGNKASSPKPKYPHSVVAFWELADREMGNALRQRFPEMDRSSLARLRHWLGLIFFASRNARKNVDRSSKPQAKEMEVTDWSDSLKRRQA